MNLILKRMFLLLLLSGLLVSAAAAQSTIFLVRHAEKAASGELSETGHKRANRLARVLRHARITGIFVTDVNRTQQTANPLAQMLGLHPHVIPAGNTALLIARLRASTGNVLVVGHSNTVPEVIRGFNILTPIVIGENDYDNMFEIVRLPAPRLIRLHYH